MHRLTPATRQVRSRCLPCNAAAAVSFCLASLGNVRTPDRSLMPPRAHWTRLVHSIVLLLNSIPELNTHNLTRGSGSVHKIQQSIVGLLYVAPHGIVVDDKVGRVLCYFFGGRDLLSWCPFYHCCRK